MQHLFPDVPVMSTRSNHYYSSNRLAERRSERNKIKRWRYQSKFKWERDWRKSKMREDQRLKPAVQWLLSTIEFSGRERMVSSTRNGCSSMENSVSYNLFSQTFFFFFLGCANKYWKFNNSIYQATFRIDVSCVELVKHPDSSQDHMQQCNGRTLFEHVAINISRPFSVTNIGSKQLLIAID